MYQYHCLNPIAEVGLKNFNGNYAKTDKIEDAEVLSCMTWTCRRSSA